MDGCVKMVSLPKGQRFRPSVDSPSKGLSVAWVLKGTPCFFPFSYFASTSGVVATLYLWFCPAYLSSSRDRSRDFMLVLIVHFFRMDSRSACKIDVWATMHFKVHTTNFQVVVDRAL